MQNSTNETDFLGCDASIDLLLVRASFQMTLLASGLFIDFLCVYCLITSKITTEISLFYLILAQICNDAANILYYVYETMAIFTQSIIFPTRKIATYFCVIEGITYNSQLYYHFAIAFSRIKLSSGRGGNTSKGTSAKTYILIAFLIVVLSAAVILVQKRIFNTYLYLEPSCGYYLYLDADPLNLLYNSIFWWVGELFCMGGSLLIYLLIYLKMRIMRKKITPSPFVAIAAAAKFKAQTRTPSQAAGNANSQSRPKKPEVNILKSCILSFLFQTLNCFSWRYLTVSFAFSDIINSFVSALLMLLLINQLRERMIGVFKNIRSKFRLSKTRVVSLIS